MKKLIALFAVIIVGMSLSACQSSENGSDAKPASHAGTWKADGFEAEVTASEITIYIVSDGSKSLYWKGSFQEGSETVKSAGDTDAMSESMFGSQDAEKTFTVDDNEIAFEMSMLGTTKTIQLERA